MTAGTALALVKINPEALRKEAIAIAKEERASREKSEHRLARLGNILFTVHKTKCWKKWLSPKTKKRYTGIFHWMQVELEMSHSSGYRILGVHEYLKDVSEATLEKLGSSRCYELVKVAVEKPEALPKFVSALEKNPDMTLYTLKQQVTNVLAGHHRDSGFYVRVEFAVKVEDEIYVQKALAVMQAIEGIKDAETPAGRGLHLVALCQEYLSGAQESEVLRKLEAAGAFDRSSFKVEEE